jgi:nitrogen-specific signal transduction histidine kinase
MKGQDTIREFINKLTFSYIFALILLAILSISSYGILNENIRREKSSAAIVNISGRQRMLSQRIALFCLHLVLAKDTAVRDKIRQDLREILSTFEKSHQGLLYGDASLGLPGKPSAQIKTIYFSSPIFLDEMVKTYISKVKNLLSVPDSELNPENQDLHYILNQAHSKLLQSLDLAVKQFQKDSEVRISRFLALQVLSLILTLSILILTGILIFQPMVNHIKKETVRLQEQGFALEVSNAQLQKEINERQKLAEELRKTSDFNEALLNTIPFGIDIVDEDCNILYMSKKLQDTFGKEALGEKCYCLYKDDKLQCENCPLKNGIPLCETRTIEVSKIRGGRTFLITHTGMVYKGKKAILEVFEDITDYKLTQKKLTESERLITIGRMAGIIAHEFRNELGVMRNAIYFLRMKLTDADEKVKKHLNILEDEILETGRIIENILTFARARQPEFKKVDIKETLLASLDKISIPQGIKIDIDIEEGLPQIEADPGRLGHVFINIILNSVQAMKENGILLLEAKKVDDFISVFIKDTGCGIKEEDKIRLFEPFFSTKARGTGLGLAAAKIMVEAHKGNISLESQEGEGTQVKIQLPIQRR